MYMVEDGKIPRDTAKYEMNVWLWRADKTSAQVRAELRDYDYRWMNITDDDFVFFYKYDAATGQDKDGNNEKNVFRFRAIKKYWNKQVSRPESYTVDLKKIWNALHVNFPLHVDTNLQHYNLTGTEKYTNIGFGVNQKTSEEARKQGKVGSQGTITFSEISIDM